MTIEPQNGSRAELLRGGGKPVPVEEVLDAFVRPFATQDVPRYTSYPTAVQFQSPFPGQMSDDWLAALEPEAKPAPAIVAPKLKRPVKRATKARKPKPAARRR